MVNGIGNYYTFRPQPYSITTGPSALFGRTPVNPGVLDWQALRSVPNGQQMSLFEQPALPPRSLSSLPPPPTSAATTAATAAEDSASALSRLKSFGGGLSSYGKGLVKGAVVGQLFNLGGQQIGQRVFGDQGANTDPTNAGQLYTRGLRGGGQWGSFGGPTGSVVTAIAAAPSNVVGNALSNIAPVYANDGESGAHLGNVPFFGSAFGGGSAQRARELADLAGTNTNFGDRFNTRGVEELSFDAIKGRLDAEGLDPALRKRITDDWNKQHADLVKGGMDSAEATARLYKHLFYGEDVNGQHVPSMIEQYKNPATAPASATQSSTPTVEQDPTKYAPMVDEMQRKALAMQGLIATLAPQLFTPESPTDMALTNQLYSQAAQNMPAEMAGWVQKAQADANANAQTRNDELGRYIMSLPGMYMQQASDQLRAQQASDAEKYRQYILQSKAAEQTAGSGDKIDQSKT